MFRFLTGLFTGKKKKATEIRNLKEEIQKTVKECHEAAQKGDSQASLRLKALEETITEQSIRLTGKPKPPSTVIKPGGLQSVGLLIAALLIPACATSSDALLNNQNEKAGEYVEQNATQPEIKQAGKDVKLNAQTLAKNAVGEVAAADQKPYTPANSAAAREGSDKSHSGGIWGWVAGGLAVILPLAFAVGRLYPPAAAIIEMVEPFVKKLGLIKQQADAQPSDALHIDDIQSHITDLTQDPVVGKLATQLLIKAHVEQAIHSPEAADLHPDHPDAPAPAARADLTRAAAAPTV